MGRYKEAEPLYVQALGLMEKNLGPDHPSVATALNNLAELYRAHGRYAEAELLHRRALGIREKALGPNHPEVAQSLSNLGRILDLRGQLDAAEKLYLRALAIRRNALASNHPAVAQTAITWRMCTGRKANTRKPNRSMPRRWPLSSRTAAGTIRMSRPC